MREKKEAKRREQKRKIAEKEEKRIKRLEKSGALDADGALSALLRKNKEAAEMHP